ncbi:MAG: hypothetical protein NTY15_13755 [Planctomycetota bacterium]|nr:hypothetical protein [Planctomycetota bacterium]
MSHYRLDRLYIRPALDQPAGASMPQAMKIESLAFRVHRPEEIARIAFYAFLWLLEGIQPREPSRCHVGPQHISHIMLLWHGEHSSAGKLSPYKVLQLHC